MPCFHPLKAGKSQVFNRETGKYGIEFNPTRVLIEGSSFKLPCGQCIGCRSDKARDRAIRCVHEARMHDRNCFVTLTYDQEHVPQDYSVRKRDLQLFHMRVQEFFGPGKSYNSVAEYGDQDGRPHYHSCLFGVDFSEDRKRWSKRNGHQVYRSAKLEQLWPYGHCEIGSLTPQSAGYCARYSMKKVTGKRADDHYFRVSPIDGELHRVEAEFSLMSRRPAVGLRYLREFAGDMFPSGFCVVDGRPQAVPRYYKLKLPELAEQAKRGRRRKDFADVEMRRRRKANETPERLAVREAVDAARKARLVRSL